MSTLREVLQEVSDHFGKLLAAHPESMPTKRTFGANGNARQRRKQLRARILPERLTKRLLGEKP